MMSLFNTKIKGGARVAGRKELTNGEPIMSAPMPDVLHIPLQQHIGAPAVPVVKVGDCVLKGQLIGSSKGVVSAPVHAPTSGTVIHIGEYEAPHPSGLPVLTLSIEPDGKDQWTELPKPLNVEAATSDEITNRVSQAGIVGMGGATFPSAVKLNLGQRYDLDLLLINGAECEPYLTCDDRLMQERADKILLGIKSMMKALGVREALIAIEKNKPVAFKAMTDASADEQNITVTEVPARYPMGSEKHLVQEVTGRETPAAGMTADLGVVVHNVATAYAVYEAVYFGRPLISRVVTVSGRAVSKPANYETLIGTPVSWLLEKSSGLIGQPKQLLMGGPMMGQPLPSVNVPIIKGSSGILALNAREVKDQNVMPCIGCGSCVTVCPCGLLPLELATRIKHEDIDSADEIGLRDCVSCGSCNYVCPSHIPLVQYFNYGKGRLKIQDSDNRKNEKVKLLTEKRAQRLEKQELAKKSMLEKKSAEMVNRKTSAGVIPHKDITLSR